MKAEMSDSGPKFNLLRPDGERPDDSETDQITQVLLSDGKWYGIAPGSFHFYQTPPAPDGKRPGVPFVQFDLPQLDQNNQPTGALLRVEVFPATVAGWAYPTPVAAVRPPERVS